MALHAGLHQAIFGDRGRSPRQRLARWAGIVAALQITTAYLGYWLWTAFATDIHRPDFFSFYQAARVALTRGFPAVYDTGAENLPYIHPPFHALLIAPLGWLPLRAAYLAWSVVTMVCLAGGIAAAIRAAGLNRDAGLLCSLAAAAFLPCFVTLLQGQSDGLVVLGLGLAALAWVRDHHRRAGLGLSLGMVKPQMMLLLPALFLARRAPGALLVLVSVTLSLCGISLVAFGVDGWDRFLTLLLPWLLYGRTGFPIRGQSAFSLRGLLELAPGGHSVAIAALIVALLLTAAALTWRPHRPRLDFALAASWSVVLSPYQNLHDLSLLVVPMILVAGQLTAASGSERPRWPLAGWLALAYSYVSMQAILVLGTVPAAMGALGLAAYLTLERLAVRVDPVPLGQLEWAAPRPRRVAVLPAYRAERTLREVVERIPDGAVDAILLVDDASDDRTAELALELGLHVIKHPENLGYGGNQKMCYANALLLGAEVVIMLHPDGQYEPELVPALCREIEEGRADMVLGSRWLNLDPARTGMPWWKRLGNRFLTTIENWVLGLRLSEYHTGYRAYSRRFLETIPFTANSNDFVFDTQVLVAAAAFGLRIGEVPAAGRYFADASSTSFGTSVVYGLETLACLLRYLLHRTGLPCRWLTPRRRSPIAAVEPGSSKPGRAWR